MDGAAGGPGPAAADSDSERVC
eukprot:SAG22_NODE_18143_length_292_cov_1.031088_1_plen_21_part_10